MGLAVVSDVEIMKLWTDFSHISIAAVAKSSAILGSTFFEIATGGLCLGGAISSRALARAAGGGKDRDAATWFSRPKLSLICLFRPLSRLISL